MEINDTTKSMRTMAYIQHTLCIYYTPPHLKMNITLWDDSMLVLVSLFADIDLLLETER